MQNNHSGTDVAGPEIFACSGGHGVHPTRWRLGFATLAALPRRFALPPAEKFGLENARKAFAKASRISCTVTTLAADNLFTLETDEHVIVDGMTPSPIEGASHSMVSPANGMNH